MKTIQRKYSKSKLNYSNLDQLAFKVVRSKKDGFYKITDNSKVRRNLPWKTDNIIQQSTIFDLQELCLLTRIHITDAKVMRIDLEIASDDVGPFVKIERDMEIVSGQIRVIKVGSLPCRFFKITVKKGCPLQDYSKIECYGLHINDIKNKYDEETLDMLFYNSYDLIYRKDTDI